MLNFSIFLNSYKHFLDAMAQAIYFHGEKKFNKRMIKKSVITLLIIAFISPIIVVFILYRFAMSTNLPGRRGGPQDAFRHTYSTALTARYLSPKVVELVTYMSETDPNSHFDQMDIHNNRIGTNIGLAKGDLYQEVMKKIKEGQVNSTDPGIVTWMPEDEWDNGL